MEVRQCSQLFFSSLLHTQQLHGDDTDEIK